MPERCTPVVKMHAWKIHAWKMHAWKMHAWKMHAWKMPIRYMPMRLAVMFRPVAVEMINCRKWCPLQFGGRKWCPRDIPLHTVGPIPEVSSITH